MNTKDNLLSPLSNRVVENTVGFGKTSDKETDAAACFFKKHLQRRDTPSIPKNLKWPFVLSKSFLGIRKSVENRNKGNKKCSRLSSRQKKLLGLNKISRNGLKYRDFEAVHRCWTDYMGEYLKVEDLEERGLDGVEHGSWAEFSTNLWKADMHGGFVRVVRSRCPVYVGIQGFIVFETKNTYKILSEDDVTRCVPKHSCEFLLTVKGFQVTFLGKNMITKPNERANKKVKNFSYDDL